MGTNFLEKRIRKYYCWDTSRKDYIRFPNELLDDFLHDNGKFVDIPINALRVIFNIIFIVRNDQFRPEDRPRQLSLFEEEFETENNVFARFTVKNSDVSPSGSSQQVITAYEFLTKFKMQWHKSINSKGEEIRTFGGLISNPTYNQRGVTSFLISRYWLRKIIVISEYNPTLYNLVYNIKNNKHILFGLWLKKIPLGGTRILLKTINNKFGLNYSKTGDFCTKFLAKVRKNLNEFSDISFNYKYEGELIYILPYRTQKINDNTISENTAILIKRSQRLRYFQKRFEVNKENYRNFVDAYSLSTKQTQLIEDSYRDFVKNCRSKKIKSTVFKDLIFLKELQNILIEKYHLTSTGKKFPNGFPRIC